jgi:dipeptidyl aminopeptidase/acylaminoacyl peptidase
MHRRFLSVLLAALTLPATLPAHSAAQPLRVAQSKSPTIDEVISLRRVGSPALSPDGRLVAYTIREANWDDDAYETEIWIGDPEKGTRRQLTRARKSSTQPAWSPDGKWLAFVSDRTDKRQVYRIDPSGGEAEALTEDAEGVNGFAWSPDGRSIAYTSTEPKSDAVKERDRKYGEYVVVDQDQRMAHLHVVDVAERKPRTLTQGTFVVGAFSWSPDGTRIAFDHRVNSDAANGGSANIAVVAVADGRIQQLVTQEGPDTNPMWSPDGSRIAFETTMADPAFYYANSMIATVPAAGGTPAPITKAFDEDMSLVAWGKTGIFFSASSRTWSYLYSLNHETGATVRHAPSERSNNSTFSLSRDRTVAAFVRSDPTSFPDIYVAPIATMAAKRVSDEGAQVAKWDAPVRDVITWTSTDGASIEGVLHKPATMEPGRRYPLLIVIHGGPTGVSRPVPFASSNAYPIDAFVASGALVLEPNYRGSAGYGAKFRALNVRNLGVGDAWDVVSGIDHLVAQGLVDKERVGSMGWSQGGYISAFLATHDSTRFRALSVGAGISNWMTYYVNTDIHPFTRQYLKATPWDDPAIYAKTSPMTYIKQARRPTLIQHGELDQRVPIPNAYELYQGLQDVGVPTRLVVFKGFGHGLTKPKANRAAMEQNLEWFSQHVLNAARGTTSQEAKQ